MALTYGATYCNTTSDLSNAFRDIDRYKGYYELDSTRWSVDSGSRYKQEETGQVNMLFENGVALTLAASKTEVDANGEWYYDSTTDILYVQCTGAANPNTKTMESGETWPTFKTTVRNNAQEILEGLLADTFQIPFQPIGSAILKESYNEADYDFLIRHMTALLTCSEIIGRLEPQNNLWKELYKKVDNPLPEPGEQLGYVQKIKEGMISIKIQRNVRQPGSYDVQEAAANTGTGKIRISGYYTGSQAEVWRIKISTAGAPGTAKYDFSRDQGSNYDSTANNTRDSNSDQRRFSLANGVYIEFVTGTFAENDYWDIVLYPASDTPNVQQLKTRTVFR